MNGVLPVITLYQPWATWIMRSWKSIETRTHDRFKSLLNKQVLIHAGQRTDETAINNPFLTKDQILQDPEEMVNGYILGSVFVHNTRPLIKSDSKQALIDCDTVSRFGLFLNQVNKFEEPILCKGEMGIWYYDMDKKEKIKKPNSNINQSKLF